MSTRRLPRVAAGFCGTAMVVSCVIAAVATFNMSNRKNALVSSMDEQPTETVSVTPMTAIAEGSLQESSRPEAPFAKFAAVSTPDFVHTDAKQSASATETPDQSPLLSQTLKPETRPVQIATASCG